MAVRLKNPAIVLNPGAAGIGVLHALQLGGVDVISVGRLRPPLLGRFSNASREYVTYRPDKGENLSDCLLALAERFDGKGVLFPSIDIDLETLIVDRDRLAARYHVPANPEIGLRIFEKNWQYGIAEQVGFPTPRNIRFKGAARPDVSGFRYPLIIKPSDRAVASGDWVFRLRILHDRGELDASLDEVARDYPERDFQVAEVIPGEPDQLYTVGAYSNAAGRVLRSYTGRKLSQYPYDHGSASLAESLPMPADVVEKAHALLDGMRFHGISQVEMKYDVRDKLYKLVEVNGRSWLWIKLAAFSGVNLPLIQYYDLTGDPRLGEAVATPQTNGEFYVYDFHVKLNNHAGEQARLREMHRTKTAVPAVIHPGEWRLNFVYRAGSLMRRARHVLSGARAPLGSSWYLSKRSVAARSSIQSLAKKLAGLR
jgi:D-aspartate ligase